MEDTKNFIEAFVEEDLAPGGRFADCAALEPVRDFKARHASTMLTFDAVAAALDIAEAKAAATEAAHAGG